MEILSNYTFTVLGYLENDLSENVLDLFEGMSVNADDVIYLIVFSACARLSDERATQIAKKLLKQISKNIADNDILLASAIHMLMRFGDVRHAEELFQINKNNVTTCRMMMKGYNLNNQPLKSITLFQKIKQENIIDDEMLFFLSN